MAKFGAELIASMSEALAQAMRRNTGDAGAGGIPGHGGDAEYVDAQAIRLKLQLTPERMAELLGMSVPAYRKWEQVPQVAGGATATLLRIMQREPEAVLRALDDGY